MLLEVLDAAVDAIERDDVEAYCAYTTNVIGDNLQSGFSPIELLAAAQTFEDAVLSHLSPDQQDLVGDLFLAARNERQALLYEHISSLQVQGA
jgi:hypothetical protein